MTADALIGDCGCAGISGDRPAAFFAIGGGEKDMFCGKCGAQLSDTAAFCNKCGNAVRKNGSAARTPAVKAPSAAIDRRKPLLPSEKRKRTLPKSKLMILISAFVCAIAVFGVIALVKAPDQERPAGEASGPESADGEGFRVEDVQEAVGGWVEESLDAVQIYSLYGTWADSSGTISFSFNKDETLLISGWDTLGLNAFTFSEVDDDTLALKAKGDNPLAAISLNMDYEIQGHTMTVSIMGKQLRLEKVQ